MTVTATQAYLVELDRLLGEPLSSVHEREKSAFDKLLAGCGNRLVLFGAGNLGRKALQCVRSVGIEPLAFADNRIKGRRQKERRTNDQRKEGDKRKAERRQSGDRRNEGQGRSAGNSGKVEESMELPVLSPQDAAEQYGRSALFLITIWSRGHFY